MGLSRSDAWATTAALVFLGCAAEQPVSARDAADATDTGRTVSARTSSERALLQQVATLPSGSKRQVGDATVVAEAPYTAASGRTCRAVQITASGTQQASLRLACVSEKVWFFVPDVFDGNSLSE